MSNDDSLIYVLVPLVFHNVHFRHFSPLKMPFLIIRQRVLLSQWFWNIFVLGIVISAKTMSFSM